MGDPVPVDVQTFESPFGKARAVIFSDGTPWFVAKDAAEGLGLNVKGTSSHVRHLKDDQKQLLDRSLISNDIPRGLLLEIFGDFAPRVLLITRGGFNDMVMESRKPVAREYRQWVTDEVLPALQDTIRRAKRQTIGIICKPVPTATMTSPNRAPLDEAERFCTIGIAKFSLRSLPENLGSPIFRASSSLRITDRAVMAAPIRVIRRPAPVTTSIWTLDSSICSPFAKMVRQSKDGRQGLPSPLKDFSPTFGNPRVIKI